LVFGLAWALSLGFAVPVFAVSSFSSQYDPIARKAVITLADVLPMHRVQPQGNWVSVDWSGPQPNHLKTSENDQPELPYVEYWISVPENTRVLSVSLKSVREEISLTAPVAPVQRPYVPAPGVTPPPLQADEKTYASSNEYPAGDYAYTITRKGSARILELKVYACKYLGAGKKIILYRNPKIKLELEVPRWAPSPEPKNVMDAEIKRKLVNPEEAFFGIPLRP
jgi:hypothetical protein